jgi:NADP-dependent 3-hydroxy acid dehydrogenase YdfG
MSPAAVVTGGGSGIGAATAERLARDGFDVVVAGRRMGRLTEVAQRIGPSARPVVMDVTDPASVADAASQIDSCDVLINNAGVALGADPVEKGDPGDWLAMFDTNVAGTMRVTQAFLPALRRSPHATIVTVTSTAAEVTYPGGSGYTATKHAERAFVETLRLELIGERIRVIEVCPGMVHTPEFSVLRFRGDQDKADAVYEAVDRPLTAEDVAECIAMCVRLPQHINVDRLVVRPVAQRSQFHLHRGPIDWGVA